MSKKKNDINPDQVGPQKGEFVAPPEEISSDAAATAEALPQQEEFWRPPVRFGSVPVEKEPLVRWRGYKGQACLIAYLRIPGFALESCMP